MRVRFVKRPAPHPIIKGWRYENTAFGRTKNLVGHNKETLDLSVRKNDGAPVVHDELVHLTKTRRLEMFLDLGRLAHQNSAQNKRCLGKHMPNQCIAYCDQNVG